ncbi:MAG: RagB/SusD family nutrient uptake outer membrane protein [Saprospiraceae bacterium]
MKNKIITKSIFLLASLAIIFTSCFNDLDTVPLDENQITAATAYENPEAYKQVLAKLYAGLSLSGQEGPAGQADIEGIDEGFGQYLRALWYHQEFPTDEAVVGWNDQTINNFHEQDWDANDNFIFAFYSRVYYQISVCNEFMRETTDEKLDERGVDSDLRGQIKTFRAEARFLRALSYWHALDHFRNVPFVTEDDIVGNFFPEQIQAADLYTWIESELLSIEADLMAPRTNEYARADQAAAWMLLSKLYLNAEVYAGKNAYSDAVTYTQKVIDSGYDLDENYQHLFLADNYLSDEIIFPIVFDGQFTRTWGGMTFVLRAGVGGNMISSDFGVESGWGGTRATSALVDKFPVIAGGAGGLIVAPQTGETYPEIFVAGSYVGWQFGNASKLSSPLSDDVYEGYVYFENANTQIKFTPNANLTVNYGDTGADGTLDEGNSSPNIVIPDAGGYKVTVDLVNLTYSFEKADWGLIGTATSGGLTTDEDMTYDEMEGAWTITTLLQPGNIKFRANDAWDINFGDDAGDAILEADGADISIATAGTYKILLYIDKPDYTYSIETNTVDSRAMFHVDGQNRVIEKISEFTEGYPPTKFKNINRDGSNGSDVRWVDIDFPMFRLADAYLMYAEAVLRGGGGDMATAVDYVNLVRFRAYGEDAGNITMADLDLSFILDERARELHWECHRRTDLVRFDQLTTNDYMWDFKGGTATGSAVDAKFNYFPIPSADIGANPNLEQNAGY